MKKPKIKPEVVWMPWSEFNGLYLWDASHKKTACIENFCSNHNTTLPIAKQYGVRIVKVRISECK